MIRIGLIDSGIGGFSILNAFLALPKPSDIHFLYIADSGHLPYGLKSDTYIHDRMEKLTHYLISQEIDALVIACNTATAVSAARLRLKYPDLPIIAIEPAVKPAVIASKTGHIAVAATQSTLQSSRLQYLIDRYGQNTTIHKIIGSSWVELVEDQKITPSTNIATLKETLAIFQQYPIDQLVLGCTHFPFLIPALGAILPPSVAIIDPAQSIVLACYNRLLNLSLTDFRDNNADFRGITQKITLFTTGDIDRFRSQSELLNTSEVLPIIVKLDT